VIVVTYSNDIIAALQWRCHHALSSDY